MSAAKTGGPEERGGPERKFERVPDPHIGVPLPMFVIDAGANQPEALGRLARLMFNIEHGAQVYDCEAGSSPRPRDEFGPNPLTMTIPGETAGSPALDADYRPTVGFIYYVPDPELVPGRLAELLSARLAELVDPPEDHLTGYLVVEESSHTTMYHQNRTFSATNIIGPKGAPSRGWKATKSHPARSIHILPVEEVDDAPTNIPSHVSYNAAFTWYITPVSLVACLGKVSSFAGANAIMASAVFDTKLGLGDHLTPINRITPGVFGIAPMPEGLADMPDCKRGLVLVEGRFELVVSGSAVDVLANWQNPDSPTRATVPFENVLMAEGTDTCGICHAPLWEDIYALRLPRKDKHYYMPVCTWCCGTLPTEQFTRAIKTTFPRTREEAYVLEPYSKYAQVLNAQAQLVLVQGRGALFEVVLADGQKAFLEPSGYTVTPPPCLQRTGYGLDRIPHIEFPYLARLG